MLMCFQPSYIGKRLHNAFASPLILSTSASFPILSMMSQIQEATRDASASLKPRVVMDGVPIRIPLVTKGDCGSLGTAFLFTVMLARSRVASRVFTRYALADQVDQEQVIVCPTGNDVNTPLHKDLRHGARIVYYLLLVGLNSGSMASLKATALAAITCHQRPALVRMEKP